jgi:hypothetical protein
MRAPPGLPRPAITRGEIAVILAFLLVGGGILVIFLWQARGSAVRVQCAENLHQMGVGILAYHEKVKPLPPSAIDKPYATWAVLIVPHLARGKGSPVMHWNAELSYFDQSDAVRQGQMSFYYCPARIRTDRLSIVGDTLDDKLFAGAVGDYACAAGNGKEAFPWDGPKANGSMILGDVLERDGNRITKWQARTHLDELKGRRAYTMLIGEKHVPLGFFGQAAVGDGSLYNGGHPASYARVAGPGYGLAAGPEAPFNNNFGSYHVNICQFLMADGNLRILTNDTPERLLGELATRFAEKAP